MREVDALQAALAAEHAAVYGYGIVGAHLNGAPEEAAQDAFDAHRAQRDRLRGLLLARQATPVAAAPAYRLPFPVTDAASAVRLAVRLEEGVAAAYADLVMVENPALRDLGAQALRECAIRMARWRGSSVPFPGLPERT